MYEAACYIAGLRVLLTALAVTENDQRGVMLEGKPRVERILGIIGGASNLSNGGGVPLRAVEALLGEMRIFVEVA